jgi:hypothetical protein
LAPVSEGRGALVEDRHVDPFCIWYIIPNHWKTDRPERISVYYYILEVRYQRNYGTYEYQERYLPSGEFRENVRTGEGKTEQKEKDEHC